MKTIVSTPKAPAAIGPYSQAVKAGGVVYCSGQIALDPVSGELIAGDISTETERVLKNVEALLAASGSGLDRVVKASVFLSDMGLFGPMNEVYARFFHINPPARETVAVKGLPRGVNVEISVIALCD
jgi:2-iminobutanoate/2-iminopropanoate deaminase